MACVRALAGAAAALTLTACQPADAVHPDPLAGVTPPPAITIRIGVLHATSGLFATEGKAANEGLLLALDGQNLTFGGKKLELVLEDTEGKPDLALAKVRKLVNSDRVRLILGPVGALEAAVVRDYVDKWHVPAIVAFPAGRALTQEQYSPYLFRVAGEYQVNLAAGWYAAKRLNYKRAAVVLADTTLGREAAAAFRKAFEAAGGQVSGEVAMPLGAPDAGYYLAQVRGLLSQSDATVALGLSGSTAVRFLKGYAESGLKRQLPLLVSQDTVNETAVLPAAGDAAAGVVSFAVWSPTLDSPEQRVFVDAYRKKYAKEPGLASVYGWVEGQAALATVRALDGRLDDPDAVAATIGRLNLPSPLGTVTLDWRNQAIATIYVRKVAAANGALSNPVIDTLEGIDQFWLGPR